MSKHKAKRKKTVLQPELIEPEMPRNLNGRVALSMSLLHLATSVITKRNPEVLSVLDEDLKRFYPRLSLFLCPWDNRSPPYGYTP